MTNAIVKVNVAQTQAPAPDTLQRTGAIISQGATTLAAGSRQLLSSAADLTAILQGALTLASLTQAAGVATGTLKSTTIANGTYDTDTGEVALNLTAAIGVGPGDPFSIAGATGTGDFADIDGVGIAAEAGSAGTVVKFKIAAGLTMTITGGNINASLGLDVGETFPTTIAGAAQSGYNGTVEATVATDKTFTYPVASTTVSPATGTVTATPPDSVELQQMVGTFFAQGNGVSPYVLELGPGDPDEGVAALAAYIAANPGFFYSYLVPRAWDDDDDFLAFLAGFNTTTSRTYFYVTTTPDTYTSYPATMKCVKAMIESPDKTAAEFSHAADFQHDLNYAPSATNRVTPDAFCFLFGVTPYPASGNSALFEALKAAGVNIVGTGAEGGISTSVLFWGTTQDGRDFTYWYSVDYVQINVERNVAAAVIAGSNDPSNPLYYNQDGINRLQGVAAATMATGVTVGLVLGTVQQSALNQNDFNAALAAGKFAGQAVVNAIPFPDYGAANPNDYAAGRYAGFTIVYVPARGFVAIVFNVNVTDFVTQ